jgi:hypothetical protein
MVVPGMAVTRRVQLRESHNLVWKLRRRLRFVPNIIPLPYTLTLTRGCVQPDTIPYPYPAVHWLTRPDPYMEGLQILNMATNQFDISKAAIHTLCICMFHALFSSTDNQAHGLPINVRCANPQSGS